MLKELLKNTRSCRTFDESRKITRDELLDMVDCTRFTPSSMNLQPLSYRLVYKKEELSKVQPITKWAGALPELELPPTGHYPQAFIIICQDIEKFSEKPFNIDVGICSTTIYLRAAELGISGCMLGSFNRDKLISALSLPENIEPLLVIALGKADETRKTVPAKDGQTRYFRKDGIHYVPKRELCDIIIEKN